MLASQEIGNPSHTTTLAVLDQRFSGQRKSSASLTCRDVSESKTAQESIQCCPNGADRRARTGSLEDTDGAGRPSFACRAGSESSLRSPAAGRDWNPTPLWLSGSKNSFNHFETKDPKVTTPTRTNESQWPLYSTPAPLSQYKVDQRCSTGLEIRIE